MLTKPLVTSLFLQSGFVLGWADIAQRLAEKRQAIPQIIPFPEIPGAPTHAAYNKFDPVAQLTSTSGDHAWIAPGPGDIRGPCPGLNAAANHNYVRIVTSLSALRLEIAYELISFLVMVSLPSRLSTLAYIRRLD